MVCAKVAFQNVQAASGFRNEQRRGKNGHVISGDEVEYFQRGRDFPVRHNNQTVVLESRSQCRQFFGTERFRLCFQIFPGGVRALEHKVFHIHDGKPFRKLFRNGHGEPVGVNNAEGLGMEACSLMMGAKASGATGRVASTCSRDSLPGVPKRQDSMRREGSGSRSACSRAWRRRASSHAGRKPAENCSSLSKWFIISLLIRCCLPFPDQ